MNNKKISVIVPCFNQAKYLEEALVSVEEQNWNDNIAKGDVEVLVGDDGSDDPKSIEIMNTLKEKNWNIDIKFFRTENRGLPAMRNFLIEKASGEYILPLDADDKIAENFLQQIVAVLSEKSNVGIVAGITEAFGSESWQHKPTVDLKNFLRENQLTASSAFRKAIGRK